MSLINLKDAYDEQTAIRLKLLKRGYRPLPTAEKVAFLPAWPTIPVNEKVIRQWPMGVTRRTEEGTSMVPAVTTAIQLQDNMLAIDVDVSDAVVVEDLEDALIAAVGQEAYDAMPYRTSGAAKFMVLCRTPEPYALWKTPKYIDGDGNDQAVEVFGGATTRYFSCFGPHTFGGRVKGRFEVLKAYEWVDGPTPLDTRPEELPLVTLEQLHAFMRDADDILAETGWDKVKGAFSGEGSGGVQYDLTRDMEFDTEAGLLSYDEALGYAMVERDARCSGSFIDGVQHGNLTRCRMSVIGTLDEPELQVFDHESWVQHMPSTWAPKTETQRQDTVRRLGAALAELRPDLAEFEDVEAWVEERLQWMLENIVFCTTADRFIHLDRPDSQISRQALMQMYNEKVVYQGWDQRTAPPTPKEKTTTLGRIFLSQDGIRCVERVSFDPREPLLFGTGDGLDARYVNAYSGLPELPPASDRLVELVRDEYLPHLVPLKAERDFLLDWLKAKVEQPWVRNCAILHLAPGVSGTGRGALFSMVAEIFSGYAIKLGEQQLFEKHNGWIDRKLMAMTDEVGQGSWSDRQSDYQQLKTLVDPTNNLAVVRRMREDATESEVFASFMLATNRIQALTFDAEDRRFAVLTNSSRSMIEAGAWADEMMNAGRHQGWDVLGAALKQVLEEHSYVYPYQQLLVPPRFEGWHRVVEANVTDLDQAIVMVAEKTEGRLAAWTVRDFIDKVRMTLHGDTKARRGDGVVNAVAKLAETANAERVGLWNVGQQRVDADGKKMTVVTNHPQAFKALSWEERGEVIGGKSGPGNLAILALRKSSQGEEGVTP